MNTINMKTKKISLFLILFFLLYQLSSVFALSTAQKWVILDNFKERQSKILFEDIPFFDKEDKEIFSISTKLNAYQSIGEKVKDKREYLEEQNKTIHERIFSLENAIEELDTDIEDILLQAKQTNDDIIYTKNQIEIQKQAIELLWKKIKENREVLLDYIIHIYKKGNYVSDGKNIDNIKAIILSGEDISDIINDMYYKWVVEITGKKLIDQHRVFMSDLYVKKIELEKQETSLKTLRKALMLEKKILDDKKALKERLLEVSKGEESLYKKYIEEKVKIEKQVKIKEIQEKIKFNNSKKKILEKYNCEFIDMSQDTVFSRKVSGECLEINKIIYAESQLKTIETGERNIFSWPVNPYYWISAYYNDPEYKEEIGSSHEAIDIVAPQGTPVKAAADGYVLFVEPPVSSWYAFVALKHGDGYVTVYGHVNEILVNEGDIVEKGEIIAKSWGEYGTKWAGILTTWPHLHFEVYKEKISQDPFEYLDLSYVAYKYIPEKYEYKFLKDFKERKGYEYILAQQDKKNNVFHLEWENEIERQKYLLNNYAVPVFRNWNIWVEEAVDGGIDPSFVMCIWLAETGLGNHLKTPYNIGNIGNTDSGATRVMTNARQGVYSIVHTLNNKYLWDYTKVSQLSRYGNKDGSIYASSSDNWHNNVTKCLSHLKQEYISDDYKFRLD